MTTDQLGTTAGLRELEIAAAPFLPLRALSPVGYAAKHALFESRSDQRRRLTAWLVGQAAELRRDGSPLRVLSIGCGDGTVDVEVARTLVAGGPVSYRGIEPHAPSAAAFVARLGSVEGVEVSVEAVAFASAATVGAGSFDLVIAVHSLYYVPDLAGALDRAHDLLAPGGRLIVVHAPREELNSLVGVLAPGLTQEFSDVVARTIAERGWPAERDRIDATLDLGRQGATSETEWRDMLDFTVQAVIPEALLGPVERALRAAAVTTGDDAGAEMLLAHPVDAFVVSLPD